MADFKAVTDGDDIYIVWTQPVSSGETDADGNVRQCREVYATALVQDENADNSAPDISSGDESNPDEGGCAWADPYRLTHTGAFTDEPNAVIDSGGNLMVLYNSYDQKITTNPQNPVEISDFRLMASYMEPCGAVEVTGITFSDETPNAGETVEVSVAVKNVGLTYANGYTVNIYEIHNGARGQLVKTITSAGRLLPGNTNGYTFEWTAPDNVGGVAFCAEAQEDGMSNTSVFESEALAARPIYQVDSVDTWQDENGWHLICNVTNAGNVVSTAADTLNVVFSGPYAMSMDYTAEECDFGKVSLEGIGVDESKSFTIDLKVIPEAFGEYGYLDCLLIGETVTGKEVQYLTDGEEVRLVASAPVELLLNGKPFPEVIELDVGQTMDFAVTGVPAQFNSGLNAVFGTEDATIAVFDGTTLKALSPGSTVIYGTAAPYGLAMKEITIRVKGDSVPNVPDKPTSSGNSHPTQRPSVKPTEDEKDTGKEEPQETVPATPAQPSAIDISHFVDIKPSDWFYNSVAYTVGKGYFAGASANTFAPNMNVTRGMLVSVLGRLDGNTAQNTTTQYTDVPDTMYYAHHVAWATANGIASGYGNNRFGPDDNVTREQMAVMIAKYLTYKAGIAARDEALTYIDADEISDWALESVKLASQQGILSGNSSGAFAPQNNATRAEVAAVIERLDKLLANLE